MERKIKMRINKFNRYTLPILTLIAIIFGASFSVAAESRRAVNITAPSAAQNVWFSSLTSKFDLTTVLLNSSAFEPPKPDFSAMEKWYEIIRYEYPEAPERDMNIYFKPKVDLEKRMTAFQMEFRDKDGIILGVSTAWICCSSQLAYTKTGETGKATVQVPSEREIDRVVSAKVVRIKDNY